MERLITCFCHKKPYMLNKRGLGSGILLIAAIVLLIVFLSLIVYFWIGGDLKGVFLRDTGSDTIQDSTANQLIPEENDSEEEIQEIEDEQPEIEINETPVAKTFDLVAINLSLTKDVCSHDDINETNSSTGQNYCNLSITSKFENLGNTDIEENFIVHIIDATGKGTFIDIITVKDGIKAGTERGTSSEYLNIIEGVYWVQIKLDPGNIINEVNETNNNLATHIDLE